MLYPQYFIDDLKSRADLVRIIQPYGWDRKKNGAFRIGCLLALLIIGVAAPGFSQEASKPVLIDEFGMVTCGDLLSRIDNLYIALANNSSASAFIVIYPKKGFVGKAEHRKKFIENVFQRRRFDLNRLRIIRGEESESEAGTFYLLPPGSSDPIKETISWSEEKLDLTKPFIFGSEGDEDPCPSFPVPTYAELIRSNPNIRGHVVIFPHRGHNRNETLKAWIKVLTVDHAIPRSQLRFFFGKRSSYSYAQFWIVPIKKK